jgi:hypothetical protein
MAGDLTLLRDVILWARANGWQHTWHPIHGHAWLNQTDQRLEVDVQYTTDRREAAMDVYNATPAIHRLWPSAIREAVDVLVALGVLPARFSTAYAAGQASVLGHVTEPVPDQGGGES